jgi:exosortase
LIAPPIEIMTADQPSSQRPHHYVVSVLLLFTLWSYWPVWSNLSKVWASNAQYSHGYLVPLVAIAILIHRRALVTSIVWQPHWLAIPLIVFGCLMRLAAGYFYIGTIDEYSIFPTFAGFALLAGGVPALKWSWPAIAFLWFMIPLHGRVADLLSDKLQRFATIASAHIVETFGFPAQTEGNVILLSEVDMGIIEACNGLRMMMTFFALSCAVAIFTATPGWKKALIILGAIPIAIICNVIRISSTAILHETAGREIADKVFHDLAGWLMMPLGLLFLWLEVWFMNKLIISPTPLKDN